MRKTPYRIPINEVRAGDILIFKRSGLLANALSWIIKILKEPTWSRWGWHMGAVVNDGLYVDAQFPKVKLSKISDIKREVNVYRVTKEPPPQTTIDEFIHDHVGKPYDCLVYLWTGLAKLLRPHIPVPRIINRFFDCWEIVFDMMDYCDCDTDHSGYDYPFITDFLRYCGEIKT